MKKALLIIIIVLLAGIFIFSGIKIAQILINYHDIDVTYDTAANEFIKKVQTPAPGKEDIKIVVPDNNGSSSAAPVNAPSGETGNTEEPAQEVYIPEYAPIAIDFEALKKINREVVGWIYCEDSRINYPVVQSLKDNFYYITHAYDHSVTSAGAIFVDYRNTPGFKDHNTIIYGHHVNNGAMFCTLEKWKNQEFFDEHPIMYLLTPEQDYKILLFSVYTIGASSDAYALIAEAGEELNDYLALTKERSVVHSDVELDPQAKYVMLSTCSKEFVRARYVVHGMLVPLDSAGGVPLR